MIAFAILFVACFIMVPYFTTGRTKRRNAATRLVAQMAEFARVAINVIACLVATAVALGLYITSGWMGRFTLVLVIGFALTIFAVLAAAERIVKQMAKSREAVLEAMTEIRGSHQTDSPPVARDQNMAQAGTPSLVLRPDEAAQARQERLHRVAGFQG